MWDPQVSYTKIIRKGGAYVVPHNGERRRSGGRWAERHATARRGRVACGGQERREAARGGRARGGAARGGRASREAARGGRARREAALVDRARREAALVDRARREAALIDRARREGSDPDVTIEDVGGGGQARRKAHSATGKGGRAPTRM
ncbi:hypothetical protein [Oryza sativa Japonica Group]|uniref:Uncharacterized protein n=1 Tax=Oryza sativa subsp. japonica TaxID=39947 RepID=Q5NAG1_ORYSJ|nr:hypothetical protein [Oryza sativa Japonica Group]BAD81545.1 hypothetical protein [Oryza sativa Japonica Group]